MTLIGTVPVPVGTTAEIEVSEFTVNDEAQVLVSNCTQRTPCSKPEPVIVTVVPGAPKDGLTPLTSP